MESRVTILMRMVISKVLPDHMTLESKFERVEGESHMGNQENNTCNNFQQKYVSCLVVFDSLRSHELQPIKLHCPWNSLGKNTGVGSHSLLQEIFPNQGLNPGLLHCRQILYPLSHKGRPPTYIIYCCTCLSCNTIMCKALFCKYYLIH